MGKKESQRGGPSNDLVFWATACFARYEGASNGIRSVLPTGPVLFLAPCRFSNP